MKKPALPRSRNFPRWQRGIAPCRRLPRYRGSAGEAIRRYPLDVRLPRRFPPAVVPEPEHQPHPLPPAGHRPAPNDGDWREIKRMFCERYKGRMYPDKMGMYWYFKVGDNPSYCLPQEISQAYHRREISIQDVYFHWKETTK